MALHLPLAKTDLGPAAVALIEKLHDIFGKPLATVLQAYADVSAEKIHAVGDIEADALRKRTAERLVSEEMRKQVNIEAIWGKAASMLEPGIDPTNVERVDEDWLIYHSERGRLFSSPEVQDFFARILAEEVRQPGYFPRRTIDILAMLEKNEAALFRAVCNFVVSDKTGPTPAIFHLRGGSRLPQIYLENGVSWDGLYGLNTIGLLKFTSPFLTDNVRFFNESTLDVSYFGKTRTYSLSPTTQPNAYSHYIHYGYVQFSEIGLSLSGIAGSREVPGFFDHLESEFQEKHIVRTTTSN